VQKESRDNTFKKLEPGPCDTVYDGDKIGSRFGKLEQEMHQRKWMDSSNHNFNVLSSKMAVKHKEKKEEHLKRKKFVNSLRGPGEYPVHEKTTDFNAEKTKEQLQFFGTTSNRFGANNDIAKGRTANADNVLVGPTSYDNSRPYNVGGRSQSSPKGRLNTAAFLGKRNQNLFGIQDLPGPQDYRDEYKDNFKGKFWETSIQAFGTTEKRFSIGNQSVLSQSMTVDSTPGPGHYITAR